MLVQRSSDSYPLLSSPETPCCAEAPTGRRSRFAFVPMFAALFFIGVGPSAAGSSGSTQTPPSPPTTQPTTAVENVDLGAKTYWDEHFTLYGFLTTAYATGNRSNYPTPFIDELILGIPDKGTFDYRNAALQLRYEPAKAHAFVLQLSHRNFGDSVLNDVTKEVELDWLFWNWDLSEKTTLRLGRFPMPLGIFNEVRDAGIVLPFFRPSYLFYREGSLFGENIDGVGISYRFDIASRWEVTTDLYFGQFKVDEQSIGVFDTDIGLTKVDVPRALGLQVWLKTPIQAIQLGFGSLYWDVAEKSTFNQEETRWRSWYLSLEADFDNWVARAEVRKIVNAIEVPPVFVDARGLPYFHYWQLGWKPGDHFSFHVQAEYMNAKIRSPSSLVGGEAVVFKDRDLGVVFGWKFRPNLTAKVEYHQAVHTAVLLAPVFTPEGLQFNGSIELIDSDYTIASLSLSF